MSADPTSWLRDLLRRVPILAVDLQEAEANGDHARIAYARAIRSWQAEAALALDEAEAHTPLAQHDDRPDPFARVAAASALLRIDVSDAPSREVHP